MSIEIGRLLAQRNMSGNSAFTVFMIFVIDMDRKPSYWTTISRNVNSYTTFQSYQSENHKSINSGFRPFCYVVLVVGRSQVSHFTECGPVHRCTRFHGVTSHRIYILLYAALYQCFRLTSFQFTIRMVMVM